MWLIKTSGTSSNPDREAFCITQINNKSKLLWVPDDEIDNEEYWEEHKDEEISICLVSEDDSEEMDGFLFVPEH